MALASTAPPFVTTYSCTWSDLVDRVLLRLPRQLIGTNALESLILVPILAEHGATNDNASEDQLEHLLTQRVLLVGLRKERPDNEDGSEEPP